MNALLAFDKFKDALSAREICACAAAALQTTQPDWSIATAPLADGGDGFCDTLTGIAKGSFHKVIVSGPLGQNTEATYGIVECSKLSSTANAMLALPESVSKIAIVELAQSSGIALVPLQQRSPWTTSTYGLGQVIQHAKRNGADAVLVGLGGSSSNDLGLCALQATGFEFLDTSGAKIDKAPTPETWERIAKIISPPEPFALPVRIACDVENPLHGPSGAAAVFGPQKGLKPEDHERLEQLSQRLAALLCEACSYSHDSMDTKGSGAAGGTAFGLMLGLNGAILPGAELVFAWSELEPTLEAADIVITGEGRFDASSLQGKGPGALAMQASERGKLVYVLAGSLGDFADGALPGIKLVEITPKGTPIEEALAGTKTNLESAIQRVFEV